MIAKLFVLAAAAFTCANAMRIAPSIKKWAVAAVTGASLLTAPIAALADAIPTIGTPAPDFVLPSNAGKDISLKDLAGKRTVLYFYPVISHLLLM